MSVAGEDGRRTEGLLRRLDELEVRLRRVEDENERLRASASKGGDDGRVSRRGLLGSAAVAVGAAAAGAGIAAPVAQAGVGTMHYGTYNNAGTSGTHLQSTNTAYTLHVANAGTGKALTASSNRGNAIEAVSTDGGSGVVGRCQPDHDIINAGVLGVAGDGRGAIAGVRGHNRTGIGVIGFANTDWGGHGVMGEAFGAYSYGVYARASGEGPNASGIRAMSDYGAGGDFSGRVAQVRLRPSSAATHPASGTPGDVFVDASKRLWFCKGGTTWKLLA